MVTEKQIRNRASYKFWSEWIDFLQQKIELDDEDIPTVLNKIISGFGWDVGI